MGPVPGMVQLYSDILIQKPVGLSHQLSSTEEEEATADTILFSSCVIGDVQWQVEQEVRKDYLRYRDVLFSFLDYFSTIRITDYINSWNVFSSEIELKNIYLSIV